MADPHSPKNTNLKNEFCLKVLFFRCIKAHDVELDIYCVNSMPISPKPSPEQKVRLPPLIINVNSDIFTFIH